jgi:hypothetical protein
MGRKGSWFRKPRLSLLMRSGSSVDARSVRLVGICKLRICGDKGGFCIKEIFYGMMPTIVLLTPDISM